MNKIPEGKQGKLCHDAVSEQKTVISTMLNNCEKAGHNIYVVTDLHLFKRLEKGKSACKRRYNFSEVLKNYKNTVKDDDVVIFLGDLCDGELYDPKELSEIILSLPGKKILVLGNNDLFGFDKYRDMGFKIVTYSFIWRNIVFSHYPLVNTQSVNVHGHLHNCKQYWIPYQNQIDAAYCDARVKPVLLKTVIAAQPEYSKHITVKEENFFKEQAGNLDIDGMAEYYDYNVLFRDPVDD